jgi:alanyl-tRNA synthetase
LAASPEEYALEFFQREGFIRKKCKVGGEYFWTLNPEQEHCNDAPCVDYYFWEVPRNVPPLSVSEARRKFIEFFNRNGHEVVAPRPVVARWREDLYLTIASIVVFQPHVTSGIVPPPANPLVIVQPSIRLEDIDNVGITLGRHLTAFEMGGHHAFNYPDKKVYWKEETVQLAFEFFTKELGIDPTAITFKESWWEGGGNAGPSFEVTVGGLELATLVFMQYRITDKGYEPIPLRIVDTGYGIERIAWFTQKTPTAFHAIYRHLVDDFRKRLGLDKVDETLLWKALRAAGRLDPEDPESLKKFYERVSRETGLSTDEVRNALAKEAGLYALLDHTKTLALMLGDSIVPSNSGEGYLARLVLRRAIRVMRRLGSETPLVELVKLQIDFWGHDYYPRLLENADYILTVTDLEEKRYLRSLEKGFKEAEKLIRKKKNLSIDDLITLYDSHGIPPDMVAEAAEKLGAKIEIPHNFYALVAHRHGASGVLQKPREEASLPRDIVEWASKFPETRRLFHEDPYMREFEANILGTKGVYLVLDATAFYPTGGGQLHDTGYLEVCGEKIRVKRVEKVGNVIVHILEKEAPSCTKARGVIDWERRYRLMRHHTGVHVLLGAARRVLGKHVWQAGAEKTPEKARLDITHYEMPTPDQIRRIEELANKAILERIPVEAKIMDRNKAEELYGFQIYQGGVPLSPQIRILRIGDWDVEACFGTHVSNTAEIGSIKIVNVDKLQDGVIRFEIVAGTEVASYARKLEEALDKIAASVGGSRLDAETRVKKLVKDLNEARRQLGEIRKYFVKMIVEKAKQEKKEVNGIRIYIVHADTPLQGIVQEVSRKLSEEDPSSITIAAEKRGNDLVIELGAGKEAAKRINLREIAKELQRFGVKGGGKPHHVNLFVREGAGRLYEILRAIEEAVAKKLESKP